MTSSSLSLQSSWDQHEVIDSDLGASVGAGTIQAEDDFYLIEAAESWAMRDREI